MKNSLLRKRFTSSLLLTLFALFSYTTLLAQDGVLINYGAGSRASSAILDLQSADQGFLAPRIDIPNLSAAAPVSSPVDGLMVYNTNATSGIGYYYWNATTKWTRLITSTAAETDPTFTGAANTTSSISRTGAITVGNRLTLNSANFDEHLLIQLASAPDAHISTSTGDWVQLWPGASGDYTTKGIRVNNTSATIQLMGYGAGIVRSSGTGVLSSGGNINLTSEVTGILPVVNGGSGIGTLTGYLKGNGTSPFSAVATIPYADITGTPTSLPPSGTAGGDLSGSYPNPQVVDDSHNHTELEKKPIYSWNAATNARDYPDAVAASFVQASDGFPSYGSVLHVRTYDNDGGTMQIYAPYSETYGGKALRYRLGQYNDAGWTGWRTIWDDNNDGAGTGMDADLLDGQHGAYYNAYANLTGIPTRANWSGVHRNFVAEQLSWKNYGNNHTIFDASAGTSPTGTAISNTNPDVAWAASYPTLMGWNGTSTYGVRVDRAKYAETAGSAPGDNLGNHIATANVQLNNFWLSNDGGNEGIRVDNSGNVGIGVAAPASKLEVVGDAITLSGANLDMNRDGYARSGISWYSKSYPGWSTYMAAATHTSVGPHGDLTAPSGTYVTSWALRNYIENPAGYGWTFESAAHPSTTPTVKFEIRASDGLFHSYGDGYVDGVIYAGAHARMGTGIAGGYYQDVTNGAYRSIVSAAITNGYYFQTNTGATTTMYVGLGGTYNGRVGIGTLTPGATFDVQSTSSSPMILQSSSAESDINYVNSAGGNWQVGTNNSGNGTGGNHFYIYDNAYRLTVQAGTGNVGIGTTTPGYKLHVAGDIYADGGWMRVSGNRGLYFESWGGGWYMLDASWIRNYGEKQMYYNTNAGDNTSAIMLDQESSTQDHGLATESDIWGYVGYSNQRWWAMYAASGFGTSSLKYKTDVEELSAAEIDQSLADVNNIQSIHYKWNKSIWEKENGNFVDNRSHEEGERPDPNQEVPSWLGFSVESLPGGIVDETGENYQYGAMIGLLIASTKALTKRTELLANSVGVDLGKLEKNGSLNKTISDFGGATTSSIKTWIPFSEEFKEQLKEAIPFITVTSHNSKINLGLDGKNADGFWVSSSTDEPTEFDYVIFAKVETSLPEWKPTHKDVPSVKQVTDINKWYEEFISKTDISVKRDDRPYMQPE